MSDLKTSVDMKGHSRQNKTEYSDMQDYFRGIKISVIHNAICG